MSELKLEIKDKENQIKDLQREIDMKQKDFSLEKEKLLSDLSSKELLVKQLRD